MSQINEQLVNIIGHLSFEAEDWGEKQGEVVMFTVVEDTLKLTAPSVALTVALTFNNGCCNCSLDHSLV